MVHNCKRQLAGDAADISAGKECSRVGKARGEIKHVKLLLVGRWQLVK